MLLIQPGQSRGWHDDEDLAKLAEPAQEKDAFPGDDGPGSRPPRELECVFDVLLLCDDAGA